MSEQQERIDRLNRVTLAMQQELHQIVAQYYHVFLSHGVPPHMAVPAIMSMLGAAGAHFAFFCGDKSVAVERCNLLINDMVSGYSTMLEGAKTPDDIARDMIKILKEAKRDDNAN